MHLKLNLKKENYKLGNIKHDIRIDYVVRAT